MNKYLLVFLLSWPSFVMSAQALLMGQGQALSAPDYVEISIVVDSKCYATPDDARKINDKAAKEIVDFLNSKIKQKNEYNTVISTGGYTQPYQTYYQDKYWCQNTFQKQNNIVFRTQDLKNFDALFNEIQNVIYKQFTQNPPTVIESSLSYVTMSEPSGNLSLERRAQLEQKAMALAFIDAKAKLLSLFGKDEIENLKLIDASEVPPEEPVPFYRKRNAPMALSASMEKAQAVPIQFEDQNISKIIYFKFTFDDIAIKN
ncbi:MAG: SIMPL domain-containing protein [Proteobacteria bacterium]|nr:SIMPL domain-containing protein [Pseudomonadota bacterium]